jgi:hypothetical protein
MNLTPDLLIRDLKVALRSLAHTEGLAIAVVLALALGIGANAAIFSVVRGVLLRPLVNRDENRLIYIRQSAPGIGIENTTFSVPEIQDLRAGVKMLSAFGILGYVIARIASSLHPGYPEPTLHRSWLLPVFCWPLQ